MSSVQSTPNLVPTAERGRPGCTLAGWLRGERALEETYLCTRPRSELSLSFHVCFNVARGESDERDDGLRGCFHDVVYISLEGGIPRHGE